jgi:hypothetical protein
LFERIDSLTKITFRRNLINTGDEGDQVYEKSGSTFVVWAIGKYNDMREPNFHHIYPKGDVQIEFGRKSEKNCYHFISPKETNTHLSTNNPKPWGPLKLLNRTITTFYARIGDAGGTRGYYGSTGIASPGIVWYINGLLAPLLYVKRGRTYNFRVEAGNNPYNAHLYHPLYITNDPNGGFIGYFQREDCALGCHHKTLTNAKLTIIIVLFNIDLLLTTAAKTEMQPFCSGRQIPVLLIWFITRAILIEIWATK